MVGGKGFMSKDMSEVRGRQLSILMAPDQLREEKKRYRPQ
jgi:hypothetical protein